MKQGNAFFVHTFPSPWPPLQNIRWLVFQPDTETECQVTACADGHLRCALKRNDETVISTDMQPIQIVGSGLAIVFVSWDRRLLTMHINGQPLKPLQEAENEILSIDTRSSQRIGQGVPSLHHPQARDTCQKWMDWRKNRYASPKKQAKKGRRAKSTAEQAQELQTAIAALTDSVGLVSNGALHFLPTIAAQLRALVYWTDRKSQYSPLLLRMAGRLGLPLPVFADPDSVTDFDLGNGAPLPIYHYRAPEATIQRTRPTQALMDLQDWLEIKVQVERFGNALPDASGEPERSMTIKEIIHWTASTLGAAHYDDDVPESLDRLRTTKASDFDLLARFLKSVAQTVVTLSAFVLAERDKTPQD